MSDLLKALALGQLLALLVALTGLCSAALAAAGLSFPTLQTAGAYALLAVVYGTLRARAGPPYAPARPAWQLLALAALDAEANALAVAAFRRTSLTSVVLLDAAAIPVALVLTRAWLGARYRLQHYAGAGACVAGLALLALADAAAPPPAAAGAAPRGAGRALGGDALALAGAALYACSNVFQEALLADVAPAELLAYLGAFGFVLSAAQAALGGELRAAAAAAWPAWAAAPWLGFSAAMLAFYSLVPAALRRGGAATLNLSLLGADLWAAAFRAALPAAAGGGGFSPRGAAAFLVAFGLVAAGLIAYFRAGDPKAPAGEAAGGAAAGAPYASVPAAEPPPSGEVALAPAARVAAAALGGGFSSIPI
jgi:solute carrier family 35 protein F1/2